MTLARVIPLHAFAYQHTDIEPGMTIAQWARAGRPVNETAPAAEATAPAPDHQEERSR